MTDDSRRHARKRVTVVGAGSWGTALALVAARNQHDVSVWAREPEVALSIEREHKNPFPDEDEVRLSRIERRYGA